MAKFLLHVIIAAFVFTVVVNNIPGAHFTGQFGDGVVYGILMSLVAWALLWAAFFLAIGTFGLAVIPLIILRHFALWLVPAIQLKVLAYLFPGHLSFDGWSGAILTGLVFYLVNFLLARQEGTSNTQPYIE